MIAEGYANPDTHTLLREMHESGTTDYVVLLNSYAEKYRKPLGL